MWKEVVASGPPEFFTQGPMGETHIRGGLWLVDKPIPIGPNSSIVGAHMIGRGVELFDGAGEPYGGFYLTPGRFTLWGRVLRLRPIRWLRWSTRGFRERR